MKYEQACEQIAKEHNFNLDRSYDSELFYNSNGHYAGKVAKLYACEKVKEVLKLAAERATTYNANEGKPHLMPCDYVSPESILSLETEILNQINKEG